MNFRNILRNVNPSKGINLTDGSFSNVSASSPLPTLLKPLLSYENVLHNRISAYDSIVLGFSSLDSVHEHIAELAQDSTDLPGVDDIIEIDENQFSAFSSCLKEGKDLLDPEKDKLCITSATGLQYVFHWDQDGNVEVLIDRNYWMNIAWFDEDSGRYFFRTSIPSTGWWDNEIMHETATPTFPDSESRFESEITILKSMVTSNTLNVTTSEAIAAISQNKFSDWITITTTESTNKTDSVKKFLNQMKLAYTRGGIKGVVYYIYSLLRETSSITANDGTLIFTDNSVLIPTEYIVGAIAIIATSVLAIVTTIVSIVQPIIGLIVSTIGSIAWSVIGSLKYDVDNTRASMNPAEDDSSAINLLLYSPMAFMRGHTPVDNCAFENYYNYYKATSQCAMYEVPGGAIFIGPGSFNNKGELTSFNWEFHPVGGLTDLYLTRSAFSDLIPSNFNISGNMCYPIKVLHPDDIWDRWTNLVSQTGCFASDLINQNDTGTLSALHDDMLYCASCLYVIIFLCWVYGISHYNRIESVTDSFEADDVYYSYDENDVSHPLYLRTVTVGADAYLHATSFGVSAPDWSNLVKYADWMNTANVSSRKFFDFWKVEGTNYVGKISLIPERDINIVDPSELSRICSKAGSRGADWAILVIDCKGFIGAPVPIPSTPIYEYNIPKYNGKTFWTWVALISIGLVVTATTAIVTSVKFRKWRLEKRAENVAKFADAQEKYQNAVKGIRKVYNPETQEYEEKTFDTSTPEGEAYIQECYKQYRRTAFYNNMMQYIVGGTRYDASSFWGEKDGDDVTNIGEDVQALYADTVQPDDEAVSEDIMTGAATPGVNQVIHLLKGKL